MQISFASVRSTIATHTVAAFLLTIFASSAFPQPSQAPARSEATRLAPMVISTSRMPTPVDELPVTVDLFSRERMLASPALTLDATLRESAAFSLFRRSSGLTAHPTAQGISLRGLGPSGASRSLILLDGIPLNDPFGGWVSWYKVPRLSLAGIEIMRGGGSGTWGNAALGGTLALTSRPLTEPDGSLAINGGDFSTYLGETSLTQTLANGSAVRLDAAAFSTDGFYTVGPDQRRAIDRRLDSEFQLVQFTWKQPLQSDIFLQISARGFREDRGNGTPLQQNATREGLVSIIIARDPSAGPHWSAVLYGQRQDFNSYFTSVDALRQSETPANDQYSVPSSAAGAAFTVNWSHSGSARTSAGVDARWVEGETREEYLYSTSRFTRRRFAGGAQVFAGIFASHDRPLIAGWRGSIAARIDRWSNRDGHRREINLLTGAAVRNDRFSTDSGTEFSPRLGVNGPLFGNHALHGRAAVYHAFRVPTLNEYHRPFRVRNVNTEANPALSRESVDGGEIGIDFNPGAFRLSLTGFFNELNDAVANVTLSSTPSLVSRQRQNLDVILVRGFEAGAEWQALPSLTLRTDLLINDTRVEKASAQPSLTGLKLAQVPRHTLTAGASWFLSSALSLEVRIRSVASQFEDDENTLRLASFTVTDLQAAYRVNSGLTLTAAIENAFDRDIETGRSSDGLVTLDGPRRLRGGLRWEW